MDAMDTNAQDYKELQPGTGLFNNKYVIEKKIGEGGFGITYRAVQTGLNRAVCIKEYFLAGRCVRNTQAKTVQLQGADEELFEKYRKAFVKEAQTLAAMHHPGIVEVIDIFDENNTSYMVMPFVEGRSLQSIVEKNGPLTYPEAVNYIGQIANAVGYIHERHILHRDIKPDNIMITADYKAVLIDFGSAREFEEDKEQSHTSMVTHGYAPTEQYTRNSRKGAYTDIYAIGATLYFVLTGQVPMEAAARITETMPEPKQLKPDLPDEANRTIMKAMQLKSQDRHQSIQEFMDDLRNVGGSNEQSSSAQNASTTNSSTKSTSTSQMQTTQTPSKKKKSKAALLVICIVGVIVAAATAYFLFGNGNNQNSNSDYEAIVKQYQKLVDNTMDNPDSLIQVKTLIQDSLVAMEESLGIKIGNRKSATLMRTLEPKLKQAAEDQVGQGRFHESENEYGLALRCYEQANILCPDRETKELISNIAALCSYMCVKDILFSKIGDNSAEPGREFDASSIHTLQPIVFFSLIMDTKEDVKLYYKIFSSSGNLIKLICYENGYTSAGNFYSVDKGMDKLILSPWGERDGFDFKPDTYRFELWNENTILFRTYLEIK